MSFPRTQYIKAELQDFWKTLWHVDVKKDHSRSYDAQVINNFLPNKGKYTTTQETTDGKFISKTNLSASREGIEFTDLFNYLTGKEFNDIRDLAIGQNKTVQLNPSLLGSVDNPVQYDIKVFNDKGQGLSEFITNDVCIFVDTASHLSELIINYKRASDKAFYYTYTREIESDPADKITYESIGQSNQESFYYEIPPPQNLRVISYPVFKQGLSLSYFYCNNIIFLRYDKLRDIRKYKLAVELSYYKTDKNIMMVVKDGANIAGALERVTNGIRELFGFSQDNVTKEMVFISKHHGDVAQSLVKFRDINIKCPINPAKIVSTTAFTSVFVSIDINAIIKALTIGVPYIIMYSPDKKRIIVWKNQNLSTPKELFESQKQHIKNLNTKLKTDFIKYNEAITQINEQKNRFDELVQQKLQRDFSVSESVVETYIELIKFGIRISVLCKYLPNERLESLEISDFETEINEIQLSRNPNEEEIKQRRKQLENIQMKIHRKQSEFIIPAEYTDFKVLDDLRSELLETGLEKEVVLNLEEVRLETYTISVKQLNAYECIDLNYILGTDELSTRTCRITTKLNSSWGMDFLTYIYSSIEEYNKNLSNLFINVIRNLVIDDEDKIKTFSFILDINNIVVEWQPPMITNRTPQSIASWISSRFSAATSRILSFVSSMFGFYTPTQINKINTSAGTKRRINEGGGKKRNFKTRSVKLKGRGRVTIKRNLPEGIEPFQKSIIILIDDIYKHCIFLKQFLESMKVNQINTDEQQKTLIANFINGVIIPGTKVDSIKTTITDKTSKNEKGQFESNKSFYLAYNVFTSYDEMLDNIELKLRKYKLNISAIESKINECRQLIKDVYNFMDDESEIKIVNEEIISDTMSSTDVPMTDVPPGGEDFFTTPKAKQIKPLSKPEVRKMPRLNEKVKYMTPIAMTPGGENSIMAGGKFRKTRKKKCSFAADRFTFQTGNSGTKPR